MSQCTNLPIASYLKGRTHERATQTVERETLSASGSQTLQVSLEGEVVRSDGLCSVLRNSLTVLNYNAMFALCYDSVCNCSRVRNLVQGAIATAEKAWAVAACAVDSRLAHCNPNASLVCHPCLHKEATQRQSPYASIVLFIFCTIVCCQHFSACDSCPITKNDLCTRNARPI